MNLNNDSAISTLLHPLGVEDFFASFWEKKPAHIERTDPTHFTDIISIESLDLFIASSELFFPDVQLIQQPDGVAKDQYVDHDNRVLPLRLIEHYLAGATVTIAKADGKIGPLGEFCRHLQSQWQMRSHANVYLSPPAHQGFGPHYDTHDVFIVQAYGKKQFNFYSNNVDLPFTEDTFSSLNFLPGERTEQITLSPGDTLYIPRGFTHDAIALDQSPSLHITIGVYPVSVRDLLQELVQLAAEEDVNYRQSIHLSPLIASAKQQDTAEILSQLIKQVATTERIKSALSRYQDQAALQCSQNSSGLLTRQYLPSPVTDESIVTVRTSQIISIDTRPNSSRETEVTTLRLPGQIVEFHQPMGAAMQWLVDQQATTVAKIPLLTNEQKTALIDKLLRLNIVDVKLPN